MSEHATTEPASPPAGPITNPEEVYPPGTDMRLLQKGEIIAASDVLASGERVPAEIVNDHYLAETPIFRGVGLGEPEGAEGEPGFDGPTQPTGMKCVVCGIDCADAPQGFVRGAPKGVVPALWQCPEHLRHLAPQGAQWKPTPPGTACAACGELIVNEACRCGVRGPNGPGPHPAGVPTKNDELAAFAAIRTELAGAAVAVDVCTVEQESGEASGNYRILEPGEVIQAGDEYRISAGGKWYAVEPGSQMNGQKAPFTVVFRRAVQGGVGLYESAQMAAAAHDNAGCMAIDPAPWWVRLGRRLFPRAWVESPEMEGGHDVLHVSVVAYFDFFDRLRILISGRVMIESRVATENKVGRSKASSVVCALPPGILEDKV